MPGRTYVPVFANFHSNPRVLYVARSLLAGDTEKLLGHMHRLWTWAFDHQEDGDLSALSDREIGQLANWPHQRDRKKFVHELISTGLLVLRSSAGHAVVLPDFSSGVDGPTVDLGSDVGRAEVELRSTYAPAAVGQRLVIHDWQDYVGAIIDERKRDRRRKQDKRDEERRKRDADDREKAAAKENGQNRPPDTSPLKRLTSTGRHHTRPQDTEKSVHRTAPRTPGGRPPVTERNETGTERISTPYPLREAKDAAAVGTGYDTTVTGTNAERAWQEAQVQTIVARQEEPWRTALEALASETPVANFLTWFEHATFSEEIHENDDGTRVGRTVWVRNGFEQAWVTEHYRPKLKQLVELVSGVPGSLVIEVAGSAVGEGESGVAAIASGPSRARRSE